jgi:hypothetical protein
MADAGAPNTPSDTQGRWLAAFDSGRWMARCVFGRWAAETSDWREESTEVQDPRDLLHEMWVGDEEDAPEPVRAAVDLHQHDWLDTTGQLTTLGRAALQRWASASE